MDNNGKWTCVIAVIGVLLIVLFAQVVKKPTSPTPAPAEVDEVLADENQSGQTKVLSVGKMLPDGKYDFGSDCAAAQEYNEVSGAKTRCDKPK